MSFKLGNVYLGDVQDQVALALEAYGEISNGALWFNVDSAVDLKLTPDKHNTARSASSARVGKQALTLYVIAFMPGDGTGDESALKLDQIRSFGNYPRKAGVVPRDKSTTQHEAHLTIASFRTDGIARPFAGCLDLVGINDQAELVRLGSLGQTPPEFEAIMQAREIADPTSTFTLWRVGEFAFGGKHSVHNASDVLQVCGFIGIPRGTDPGVLRDLGTQLPAEAS